MQDEVTRPRISGLTRGRAEMIKPQLHNGPLCYLMVVLREELFWENSLIIVFHQ